MGTEARLLVVTNDPQAGEAALLRAARDLEETEHALSRFEDDSDLGRLNRSGRAVPGERLLAALRAAIYAYEWSDGLLDPRVIGSLEPSGYRDGIPDTVVEEAGQVGPLSPVDMRTWIGGPKIAVPSGVRLDLAEVAKALGIGWAAAHLAGHAGLLVDVGGDVVALGADEEGEPWSVAVAHQQIVGQFTGSRLAIATSTTTRRALTVAGGKAAHYLIDPRTGAPSGGDILFATVAAPTILEADLAAKLLIILGKAALRRLDERCRILVTDHRNRTSLLDAKDSTKVGR